MDSGLRGVPYPPNQSIDTPYMCSGNSVQPVGLIMACEVAITPHVAVYADEYGQRADDIGHDLLFSARLAYRTGYVVVDFGDAGGY